MHRGRVEKELHDEVRATFEMLVDDNIARGMTVSEARRAATVALGRIDVVKDRVRDVRAGAVWDGFLQDVRYGARLLSRNPLFTLTAVLSLAICLGANTTVFTVANRLLFRNHLGVADPARLVDIAPTDGRKLIQPVIPYRTYAEIRDRTTTLEGVYGYALELQPVSMQADGRAERIFTTLVSTNYFTVLGVGAAAGRLFGVADGDESGGSPIIVLSHAFWTRRCNADPAIVGQTVQLNGHPMTVVGVAAAGF